MGNPYDAWIVANVPGDGYGRCGEVTLAMLAAFPELTRVRGHYLDPLWGEREHWWLVTPWGEIIDPTAAQFPSRGRGVYTPWPQGQPEPTGICANCGKSVYDSGTCCSDECGRAYAAYCLNPF